MIESAPRNENDPRSAEAEAILHLKQQEQVISVELSPYSDLVESYELDVALAEKLKQELGEHYETFLDLVTAVRTYLRGPLIKDTFGNYHEENGSEHTGQTRREFVRSMGESGPARQLLDQNRLKIGTHTNAIFPRLELLEMLTGSPTVKDLFADVPREAYEKLLRHEELTEDEKEQWVADMDAFAVAFLKKTG